MAQYRKLWINESREPGTLKFKDEGSENFRDAYLYHCTRITGMYLYYPKRYPIQSNKNINSISLKSMKKILKYLKVSIKGTHKESYKWNDIKDTKKKRKGKRMK